MSQGIIKAGIKMVGHNQLRDELIQSDNPPNGEWWVNVPVGFRETEISSDIMDDVRADLKEIDAICLTGRQDSGPWVAAENYSELYEQQPFEYSEAVIVEVKPEGPTFKGIGQLMGYSELFEEDWRGIVSHKVLLVDGIDEVIGHALTKIEDIEQIYRHEL